MASKTPPCDAEWLRRQRWFAAKTLRIEAVDAEDTIALDGGDVVIARVHLADGSVHRYAVALAEPRGVPVREATDDPRFCRSLLRLIAAGAGAPSARGGEIRGRPTTAFASATTASAAVRLVGSEQSNTSIVFDDRVILKFFRRLIEGVNPEQEIGRFLTERTGFRNTPRLAGDLEYRAPGGGASTLAVLQEFVPGARDGWTWTLNEIAALYARAATAGMPARTDLVAAWAARSVGALGRLGAITAGLHRALGSDPDDPAFAPETITADDVAMWARAVQRQVAAASELLGDPALLTAAPLPAIEAGLRHLVHRDKSRHHGDLHLGQTLYREPQADFIIIDFEGEPLRPLAERRQKHSPLRDVAGVLRSIDYAATCAPDGRPELRPWADAWAEAAAHAFLAGYGAAAAGARFVPEGAAAFGGAVAVFELEKAAYEVVYEANNRPQWVAVPRRGLLRAASRLTPSASAGAA